MSSRTLPVKEVCERYGVSGHTVLGWIRRGELRAIDVSRQRGGKPRWRITQESLEAFELIRTHTPPPPPTRRRKRQHHDVIEFY